MAARRQRIARAGAGEADRASAILVEDLRSQFKVFGEALQGVASNLEGLRGEVHGFRAEVATRFEAVDARFDGVDARFDGIDARFDGVDARFQAVDARFDEIHREIGLVKVVLVEHTRDIREIRGELREVQATATRVEAAFDRKVDRDEVEAIVSRASGRP